jgi:hypothetical protein
MAIKTFTTGEVLTASDTNTYLANAGLVFVSGTTITAGASSVVVSNCFNSSYDRYKIVVESNVNTAGGNQGLILTPNVTGASNFSSILWQVAGATSTVVTASASAATYFLCGFGGNNQMVVEVDNYNPRTGTGSTGSVRWSSYDGINSTGGTGTWWSTTTGTNTGFTFASGGGYTLGAGRITVYGYRIA